MRGLEGLEKTLPEGWEIRQFLECIEKDASSNKLKIPQSDFQDKGEFAIIDQGTKYIAGYTDNPLKVYTGELPVIIFGDHTRIFKFVDFPFSLGADGTKMLVPKKNLLNPKYFYFFLRKLRIRSHGYSRHYKFLKEKQILIPPRQTQNKIVLILEKAEETKKIRAQADELMNKLIQSVFLEMFGDSLKNPKGWEIATLENVCCEIYRYPTFYGFEYSITGVPVVRISNICSDGMLDPDVLNYVFIDPKLNKKFPRTILEINDIVMAVRGDGSTAKRIGLVDSVNLVGANISPNLLRFKAKEEIISPLYLFYLMISDRGQRLLEKYVTRTAKKTITAKEIKKIGIPIPPLTLQKEFVKIIERLDSIGQKQHQSQQEIDNLFNTLIQKAFKGELTA